MPQIPDVPRYQPLDPYIHLIDNIPIDALVENVITVNNQVDINTVILGSAIGTQGTLANRLAQSIEPDGSLKTIAIDNALHKISEHTDADGYVRMTLDERNKLSFISPQATALKFNFETISGSVPFVDETVQVNASDSISWRYESGAIYADTNFPSSVRHAHYYGLIPDTDNYLNFTTTTVATPYIEGSLRIYINGVRLNTDHVISVPFSEYTSFMFLKYTEGTATDGIVTGGDFSLNDDIPSTASIIIDFDILYN